MKALSLFAAAMLITSVFTGCAAGTSSSTATQTTTDGAKNTTTSEQTTAVTTETTGGGKVTYADSNSVKPLGRTYFEDNILWLSFSGSGAEFDINASSLSITMKGDTVSTSGNKDSQARIAIYLDGERVVDDMLDEEETVYEVFKGESARTATVSVVKLSECANSSAGIAALTAEGLTSIAPTPEKDYFIEFIGDSITCGYGVDDEVKEHHFSTTTEDVTKAYAYKTAELLDADYSLVSISGYGVISGYSTGPKVEAQTISQYYDKLGFSYGYFNGKTPADITWSFEREPDLIVINLGTNDSSYAGSDSDKKEEYATGYVEFLKKVRGFNPNAKILCVLGIMGASLYDYVEYAVYNYTDATGDTNVFSLPLDPQNGSLGYAADWHPTEGTHAEAAQTVADYIKQNLK